MSQRKGQAARADDASVVASSKSAAAAAAASAPADAAPASPSLWLPAGVFACVLAIYLRTAYPSITGGDSGELVVTTCNLGIAHPPGYPLYTMLGWAWSRLLSLMRGQHVHVAYALNCMSALLGSIAAAALAYTTALMASRTPGSPSGQISSSSWSGATIAGVYASVGFACMPTVWLYSIQGEVFALNNALMAILILLTVQYYSREERIDLAAIHVGRTKKGGEGKSADASSAAAASVVASPLSPAPRSLLPAAFLGAFVCGLCLTNQHTTVFPVVVTSGFITLSLFSHGLLSGQVILGLIYSVVAGLSPYAFLLIRSRWKVVDSWGDQRSLSGFLVHLLRQEYGTFQLAASEISTDPGMWSRLGVYGENMRAEMMLATPILALIGLWACARSPSQAIRRSSLVLFLGFLVYVLVFHKLANLDLRPLFLGVQARFWQQSNMYVYLFSAIGVKHVAESVGNMVSRGMAHGRSDAASTTTMASRVLRPSFILTSLYCTAYTLFHVGSRFHAQDHSSTDAFYRTGVAMLNSFPENSIVLLNGDLNNNMLKYPQSCEGIRPDLSLVSLQLMSWEWFVPMQRGNYPNVTFPGIRYHVSTPQSFNIKKFLDVNVPESASAGGRKKSKAPGGVFLCGPWKDGDHSNIRNRPQADGTPAALWFEEHPFGQCAQLLPFGSRPGNVSDFLRRGWAGLPSMDALPPYDAARMGEETWERVLYKDNWTRLLYLTSYAAFNSNRAPEDIPLLKLAFDQTEELMSQRLLLSSQKMMGTYEYRSAGVVYGLWAKHLDSLSAKQFPSAAHEAAQARRKLYAAWLHFCTLQPGDPEIWPFVRDRLDPYAGMKITGIEEDAQWPEWQRVLKQVTAAAAAKEQTQQQAANSGTKKQTKQKAKK